MALQPTSNVQLNSKQQTTRKLVAFTVTYLAIYCAFSSQHLSTTAFARIPDKLVNTLLDFVCLSSWIGDLMPAGVFCCSRITFYFFCLAFVKLILLGENNLMHLKQL